MAFIIGLHIGISIEAFILALDGNRNVESNTLFYWPIKNAFLNCHVSLCWWSIASSQSSDNWLIIKVNCHPVWPKILVKPAQIYRRKKIPTDFNTLENCLKSHWNSHFLINLSHLSFLRIQSIFNRFALIDTFEDFNKSNFFERSESRSFDDSPLKWRWINSINKIGFRKA